MIAHAIWRIDQRLDRQNKVGHDNIIEQQVVPALLRMDPQERGVGIAVQLGGSVVVDYLMRHDWRSMPTSSDYVNGKWVRGKTVNRWLYWLSYIREPQVQQWRIRHKSLLMNFADDCLGEHHVDDDYISFLFNDQIEGSRSLARAYWPRYEQLAKVKIGQTLNAMCDYLVRMGDDATEQMYIQAIHVQRSSPFWIHLDRLHKLQPAKRIAVLRAMRDEVEKNGAQLAAMVHYDVNNFREQGFRDIDEELLLVEDVEAIDKCVAQLVANEQSIRKVTAQWLVADHADHALVARLAEHEDAGLRLLVMDSLREHPSPRNRGLLKKLLEDEDQVVRQAAREVARAVKALVVSGRGH